jgi:hypothetical protein
MDDRFLFKRRIREVKVKTGTVLLSLFRVDTFTTANYLVSVWRKTLYDTYRGAMLAVPSR